ncbi:unnamed protein product [Brassica rapa subsp. trilocularis]|uniref:Uncharacterized protein n=1 Tax=Brassica campestris TaxID=3711 RepID=A0A3P5ZC50_BRACM|nr:unnamed protein product [Brassica rapa]
MGTKNTRYKTNNNCAEINSRQHHMHVFFFLRTSA